MLEGGERMSKRFELRSWNYNKLQGVIYDYQNEETLRLSLYEIIELLNKVSQSEYDLRRIGNDIQNKLDELFKKGLAE